MRTQTTKFDKYSSSMTYARHVQNVATDETNKYLVKFSGKRKF